MALSETEELELLELEEQESQAMKPQPKQDTGFFSRVGNAFDKRALMEQGLADQAVDGKQSAAESIGEIALSRVGGPIADVAGEAINTVSQIPRVEEFSNMVRKLGSYLPLIEQYDKGISAAPELYNKLPQRARNAIEAGGNALNIAGAGMAAKPIAKTAIGAASSTAKNIGAASKNMVVKNKISSAIDDVLPIRDVKRTEIKGINKKYTVTPREKELQSARYLAEIDDYRPSATFQEKYNVIKSAIGKEAEFLDKALADENTNLLSDRIIEKPFRIDEFGGRVNLPEKTIDPTNKFYSVLEESVGDMKKNPLLDPSVKRRAKQLVDAMKQFVADEPQTAQGLLNARKKYDDYITSVRPKIFDAKVESAITEANRVVRQTTNDFIASNTSSVDVLKSLEKQFSLYRAKDVVERKALDEATTALGRAEQKIEKKIPFIGTAKQVVIKAKGLK